MIFCYAEKIHDKNIEPEIIIKKQANQNTTLMLWNGNRQAQEYTDTHVFTTVYNQDSFEPANFNKKRINYILFLVYMYIIGKSIAMYLKSNSIGVTYNSYNNKKTELRLHSNIFLETADLRKFYVLNDESKFEVEVELEKNTISLKHSNQLKKITSEVEEVVNIWNILLTFNSTFTIAYDDTMFEALLDKGGVNKLRIYDNSEKDTRIFDIKKSNDCYILQTYKPLKKTVISLITFNDDVLILFDDNNKELKVGFKVHPLILNMIRNLMSCSTLTQQLT